MQVSVARYLRTPPYAAKRKGLSFDTSNCLRSQSHRSTVVVGNCTCGPITVVPHRAKAGPFRRSSILFRPLTPATSGDLVEPPGTAPGSEPFITGAFIAIVPANRNTVNIGGRSGGRKDRHAAPQNETRAPKRNAPKGGPGRVTVFRSISCRLGQRSGQDQNPALMFSNSCSIRSRIAVEIGVCASRVPSTGSTSAAFNSSSEMFFIPSTLVAA